MLFCHFYLMRATSKVQTDAGPCPSSCDEAFYERCLFGAENEHIHEQIVITKQRNNCESEFILPGLVQSLHLSPLKTELQFHTSAWSNILHHQQNINWLNI